MTWVIGGFFALVVGKMVVGSMSDTPTPPPKTPEQTTAEQRRNKELNMVLNGARWLKGTMKKPESFELVSAVMLDGKVICYEYKARNSWNDVTRGVYVISDNVSSDKSKDWNRLCANKSGEDYTSVRAVL